MLATGVLILLVIGVVVLIIAGVMFAITLLDRDRRH
jgi:hypothetical protein